MKNQWVKRKASKKSNKTIRMNNYQMNPNKRKNIMVNNLKINKKIKTRINKKTKRNNKKQKLKNKRKWVLSNLINNRFLNLNNQYQLQELKNQKHQKLGKIILNLYLFLNHPLLLLLHNQHNNKIKIKKRKEKFWVLKIENFKGLKKRNRKN